MADILLIDDQDRYATLFRRVLKGHRLRGPARSWREAAEALGRARGRVDLVLLDVHFEIPDDDLVGAKPGMGSAERARLQRRQGIEILALLRRRHPELPVILMTSRQDLILEDEDPRVDAQEYTYFLTDDTVDVRSLQAQIAGIIATRREESSEGPVYWGQGMVMRRIRRRLAVLARGRLPVVLLGPTGTGKSLIARHIVHKRSGRSGAFVAVDLSTLPRDLMAAHLFGSVRGAYTGSVADRTGAFEAAHGGTLFLDELGNLPIEAQKLLLSVLQEGVVTRLGELRERAVDVKLVVATNEDLAARVVDGSFRADLYMRLNPATAISLPALQDRGIDLAALLVFALEHALRRPGLSELVDEYCRSQGLSRGSVLVQVGQLGERRPGVLVLLFPERALRLLRRHSWPGNLREFAMVVENAVLFALAELTGLSGESDRPDVVQVRPKLIGDLLHVLPLPAPSSGVGQQIAVRLTPHDTLNKVSQSCERQIFEALFLEHGGDFSGMARVLLGEADHARKVQLRFNQLGLKVREIKAKLP